MEEEKKEVKKQEAGTKKSNKKTIIIAVSIVCIILILVAVYLFIIKNSPGKAVENMLNDLKTGTNMQSVLTDILQEENLDQETQKLVFEKLKWKIISEKQEGDRATVEVEITNKDFKTIINNYMQKVIKIAFSGEDINEDEVANNYLVEEMKREDIPDVTTTQSIIVEKKDGKWEVSEENDFATILLPGFMEALSSFGE